MRILRCFPLFLIMTMSLSDAQTVPADPNTGIQMWSTNEFGIDLATSAINVQIPVRSKAGVIPFSSSLVGTNQVYIYSTTGTNGQKVNNIGFSDAANPLSYVDNTMLRVSNTVSTGSCGLGIPDYTYTNFTVTDLTGAVHPFPYWPVNSSPFQWILTTACATLPGPTVTTDGSGYTLVPLTTNGGTATFALYEPNGRKWAGVCSYGGGCGLTGNISDPDGNSISEVQVPENGWTVQDTLNTIVMTVNPALASNPYSYTTASDASVGYTLGWSTLNSATNFGCPGVPDDAPGSGTFLTSVTRPDGAQYTFGYELTPSGNGFTNNGTYYTGRIGKITFPTGGSISYAYSGGYNGFSCEVTVPTITVTTNDNNGNTANWTYVNNGSTVVKTDPASNQTVYYLSGEYQTQVSNYEGGCPASITGCNGGGTLLRTTTTCYNGNFTNCLPSRSPSILLPISQTDVYTSINGSSTNLVETTFDTIYGNTLEVKKYDFGVAMPPTSPSGSTPVSDTVISYGQSWNSTSKTCSAYPAGTYINNTPCYSHTKNSSGTDVAKTQITYSNTGHPLSTAKWTSGSTLALWLTSTATYNSNGTVATATDVNGTLSTYSYGGTGGCNSLLATSVKVTGTGLPSGGLTTSTQWDCNGAVITSTTDPNGQVTGKSTTMNYDVKSVGDPFYRPLSVVDPLGNTASLSYSTTTSESAMNFNGTVSTSDTLTTIDGLGRQIFAQTRQGQGKSTFDTVQTSYGWTTTTKTIAGGSVTTTSVPYSGTVAKTAPSGTGVTTSQNDAIGRPISVTDSGGGSATYQYIDQDTVVSVNAPSNENPKVHQYESNGLGWLTSVCEVTAGTTSFPGEPCSPQVNAETGYLTQYSYNALGNLQSVTQSANGKYAQGRSYIYDGLGRLTQEKNPESGTVNYTYDSVASGNCAGTYPGDLVMEVDNLSNVVCGQYDGLHRTTTITYPAGPYSGVTPSKGFVYDATSETCSDSTGSNVLGRLADAYTGTSSAKKVNTQYCYSPRGQTTDVFQSTPNSGGYAHLIMTYWANYQTDTINGIPKLSNLYYTLDGEGRINSFVPTAISPDPIKTISYNPASQITNVNFYSGETDAYSYDVMNRLNKYTYTLGSSSLVGVPTWNSNWTLGSLNISDQFNSANNQDCSYTHDDLVRISNVSCTGSGWGQAFTYDQFGNITKSGSSSWMPAYYTSGGATANQYVGGGATYDGNGNLTNDTFNTYTWDADGNYATVNGSTTNTYDAFDKLVETSAGPTQFVYLPGGTQPFATMSNYESYLKVFAPAPGGAMIITPNGSEGVLSYHRHTDWIGSSRFATTPSETMYSDGAYAPFGEPYAPSGTTDLVFGGNAQDASAVEGATAGYAYDTLNRRYSAAQSRWIMPDPAGLSAVDPSNPQTWNRYAYVMNNPLAMTDMLGLDPHGCQGQEGQPCGTGLTCGGGSGLGGGATPCPWASGGCTSVDGAGCVSGGLLGNIESTVPCNNCQAYDDGKGNIVILHPGAIFVDGGCFGCEVVPAALFAPDPTVEQNVKACESGIKNSTAGKVVAFGSFLSFVDNTWDTAKNWTEAILTKGAYFKIMQVAGQSATPAGETTYVTTVVKPAVGKAATMGTILATVTDLALRAGCRIANDPRAMSAYTGNPF
jgi:RHS repeat-associated protein